jgi:hypothetical protein
LVFLLLSLEEGGGEGGSPPPAAKAESAGALRKIAVTISDNNRTVDLRMRLSRFQ